MGINKFSVLIGGKAGFGIDKAGSIIGRILGRLGYRVYVYRDYPSLIRGGHTFSIIRADTEKVGAHQNNVDFILALNQDTIEFHRRRLSDDSVIIYDSDAVKLEKSGIKAASIGITIGNIIKEYKAPEITRNTCIVGGFCRAAGIDSAIMEDVFKKDISKELDINLRIALRGYNEAKEFKKVDNLKLPKLPVLTGNEAIGLGLVKGGLNAYVAYPMTPSSGILHFMASSAEDFGLKVLHPESEIGVILMALGFSYAGERSAVGTSGGGFCLMTEGLSLAGMAELPVVIVMGQRTGPSTGLPTYTGQTELNFVMNAGQGEFPRLVVAPSDAEEAYYWSAAAMNLSWKFQVPSIILSDKTMAEGAYSFDIASIKEVKAQDPALWDRIGSYKRYQDTATGVSPLDFTPDKDAVIKVNSYEHDEFGITTEDAVTTAKMASKRLRKEKYLEEELEKYSAVNVFGRKASADAILCWGSNRGVCVEAARASGMRVVQPVVLWPFPAKQFRDAMDGVKNIVCVENNATGQLAKLVESSGYRIDKKVLRYDGRPFTVDELIEELGKTR